MYFQASSTCHWSASWLTRYTVAVIPGAFFVPAGSEKQFVMPRIVFFPSSAIVWHFGIAVRPG